jgi:putative membrane protein
METGWHRTSPVAVLFFIGRFLRRLFTDGLPALAPLVALLAAADGAKLGLIVTGLVVLAGLATFWSILSYLRFQYRIEDKRVLVRSGVLHREQLIAEFDRIQNVSIREPVYMRPFDLALLSIDTAGSGKKEITLGGVRLEQARSLRAAILAGRKSVVDEPATELQEETPDPAQPTLLLERDTRDIMMFGLTANFLLWLAIAMGVFFGTPDMSERFFGWVSSVIDFEQLLFGGVASNLQKAGLVVAGLLFVALVLLPGLSMLGALFRHHGYRLTVDEGTYRRHSGLMSRHDESLKRHKIQAVEWKQNFMARWFGRINLQLRVASAGSGEQQGAMPGAHRSAFMVPVVSPEEARQLTSEFLSGCQPAQVAFSPINRLVYARKYLFLGWTLPILGVSATPIFLGGAWFVAMIPVLYGIAWLILWQQASRYGYSIVGDCGFVRRGFIGTWTTVFPLFKVQRVDIRQTPGQRRKGLANLTIHLASHSVTVPYLPLTDAERLRDLAMYHVESSSLAWY